jgi:hypothetical protein
MLPCKAAVLIGHSTAIGDKGSLLVTGGRAERGSKKEVVSKIFTTASFLFLISCISKNVYPNYTTYDSSKNESDVM